MRGRRTSKIQIYVEDKEDVINSGELLGTQGYTQVIKSVETTYEHYLIFKVPDILHRYKKDSCLAYRPYGFSIGPFHHGTEPYAKVTQQIKDKYLEVVVNRFVNSNEILDRLHAAVTEVLEKARLCYAEQVNMEDNKFVHMLVRDSCFIIELFARYFKLPYDIKYTLPSSLMLQFTYHDLILLENQIPWFVLRKVFEMVGEATTRSNVSLHFLVINYFRSVFPFERSEYERNLSDEQDNDHILDLLRRRMFVSFYEETNKQRSSHFTQLKAWVSRSLKTKGEDIRQDVEMPMMTEDIPMKGSYFDDADSQLQIPNASRLREAGVKFKRSISTPMLHVKFDKGVLELPQLLIHDNTETLFRNLIAFEQCRYKIHPVVTAFARLMDCLIDTEEDVHILRKHGIICNNLDPQDAVQVFNRLCSNTSISMSYYRDIYKDVNSYCGQWWPRWRAFYLQNYFGKPWAIISQIFALIILVLAILQVVFK